MMRSPSTGEPLEDVACNLCGLSCVQHLSDELAVYGGLINARVCGGYSSTPGNGVGALDDTVAYKFSLCEFCLDWLFSQFKIPVAMFDYMGSDENFKPADLPLDEPWRSAAQRVAEDDWRGYKEEFTAEAARRAKARERAR